MKIHLPVDFVGGKSISDQENAEVFTIESGIREGFMGLDCGSKTIALNDKVIQNA